MPELPDRRGLVVKTLIFRVDVETDGDTHEGLRKIIDHIDQQISGLPQRVYAHEGEGTFRPLTYEVTHLHGEEKE